MKKMVENLFAINDSLDESNVKKKEKLKIMIEDVKKMNTTCKLLDVLEEGITLLGGEKYSTGSVVLPFEKKLLEYLEENQDDPVYLAELKQNLRDETSTRCDSNLNRKLLGKASFFYPRFKDLSFLDAEAKKDLLAEIEDEIRDLEKKDEGKKNKSVSANPVEVGKEKKKIRFLGASLRTNTKKEGGEEELKRYALEKMLDYDESPFDWWKRRKEEFSLLARLARKYLSVQATSTPAERMMSRLGLILTKRRLAMTGDHFDMIMFLSDKL